MKTIDVKSKIKEYANILDLMLENYGKEDEKLSYILQEKLIENLSKIYQMVKSAEAKHELNKSISKNLPYKDGIILPALTDYHTYPIDISKQESNIVYSIAMKLALETALANGSKQNIVDAISTFANETKACVNADAMNVLSADSLSIAEKEKNALEKVSKQIQ